MEEEFVLHAFMNGVWQLQAYRALPTLNCVLRRVSDCDSAATAFSFKGLAIYKNIYIMHRVRVKPHLVLYFCSIILQALLYYAIINTEVFLEKLYEVLGITFCAGYFRKARVCMCITGI